MSHHPSFVAGFVKQCHAMGLDENMTVAAFATFDLQENLKDSDFKRGFDKKAAGGDLLSAIKNLGASAQSKWNGLSAEGKGALVGAGVGGLGGLALGGKNKLRNALLGVLLGGGAGYGLGHLRRPNERPVSEEQAMRAAAPGTMRMLDEKLQQPILSTAITGFTAPDGTKKEIPGLPAVRPLPVTPAAGITGFIDPKGVLHNQ